MTIKNIPVGYKDSPLGIIPMEWEVKRLGEVLSIGNGKDYKHLSVGHIPVFGTGGIITYVDNYLYNGDTVCIGRKGTINKPIFYSGKIWTVDTLFYTYAFKTTFARYIYLLFQIIDWKKYNEATGVPSLSKSTIERIMIPLPPLAEQEKIAEILTTWDKAIEKQTQLIQKLELRKKGLMQQLLTGKKRLPGFTGEWKRIAIKDFAVEISLKNKQGENWEVLSCTKYEGLISSLQYFGRQMFAKDISQYKVVPQFCFAYATNHIEEGSIGYQSVYANALISPMYTVFKTDENLINDAFLYKLLKSHHAIYLYNAMMEGSIDRRGGLRWDNFSKIKFVVPSLQEQTAIANILSSCDEEIRLAQDKLAAMKEQKKGLMQVLLTGKRRVNK